MIQEKQPLFKKILSVFMLSFLCLAVLRSNAQSIERVQFSGLSSENNAFQVVAGAPFGSFLPTGSGNASLTVSSEAGQGSFLPTSINPADLSAENGLRVYPNPVVADLQLEWQGRESREVFLKLLDAAGRQVKAHRFRGKSSSLSLRELPAGSYRLQQEGNKTQSWSIIKN